MNARTFFFQLHLFSVSQFRFAFVLLVKTREREKKFDATENFFAVRKNSEKKKLFFSVPQTEFFFRKNSLFFTGFR